MFWKTSRVAELWAAFLGFQNFVGLHGEERRTEEPKKKIPFLLSG